MLMEEIFKILGIDPKSRFVKDIEIREHLQEWHLADMYPLDIPLLTQLAMNRGPGWTPSKVFCRFVVAPRSEFIDISEVYQALTDLAKPGSIYFRLLSCRKPFL